MHGLKIQLGAACYYTYESVKHFSIPGGHSNTPTL